MLSNKTVIADLIFKNGAIYTVDSRLSWAQAVAVKNTKIIPAKQPLYANI